MTQWWHCSRGYTVRSKRLALGTFGELIWIIRCCKETCTFNKAYPWVNEDTKKKILPIPTSSQIYLQTTPVSSVFSALSSEDHVDNLYNCPTPDASARHFEKKKKKRRPWNPHAIFVLCIISPAVHYADNCIFHHDLSPLQPTSFFRER